MPEPGGERLPYPGLRPFEADEADLFFGREQQVDGLLKRLSNSHFVAVVGESGAGKSSLVRAGLLPALEAGFVVEASAALSILLYLAFLWLSGRWNQKFSAAGFNYSLLTGICVGAGTIAFFLLFQKGGPLSSVPAILAGGAALMAVAGILFFHEAPSWQRLLGIVLAIAGLLLLRR